MSNLSLRLVAVHLFNYSITKFFGEPHPASCRCFERAVDVVHQRAGVSCGWMANSISEYVGAILTLAPAVSALVGRRAATRLPLRTSLRKNVSAAFLERDCQSGSAEKSGTSRPNDPSDATSAFPRSSGDTETPGRP